MNDFEQNKANMIAYLQKGCKSRDIPLRFGVELEHFIVKKDTKKAISYYGKRGVEAILNELACFYTGRDYSQNHLIALQREDITISLEPAAQLEVSISPQSKPEIIEEIYDRFQKEIDPILQRYGYCMVTEGYQPCSKAEELDLIPKQRYRFMDTYFDKIGPYGKQMMRGTASAQVSIDYYSEEDFRQKYQKLYQANDTLAERFANTHTYEQKVWECGLLRKKIWENTDKRRYDVEPFMKKGTLSFSDYIDFVMQAPIIVNRQNGEDYYDERTIGEICSKRILTQDEFVHAMSMVFPMIRAKQFLEIRYADSMPISDLLKYIEEIKKIIES